MPAESQPRSGPKAPLSARASAALAVFRQVPPTFRILWRASPGGTLAIGALTACAALIPAAVAYTGKLIVDGVVAAAASGSEEARRAVLLYVGLELVLMAASTAVARVSSFVREVVGARLSYALGEAILEKALTLQLQHFEDSEVYDKMQNARRESGSRPISLVVEAFSVVQGIVTLTAYAALVLSLSVWSVVILLLATVPSFLSEVRYAAESFRLTSWRAPEGRKLNYLEWILTRDSHVKEVKLFDLGPLILGRYRELFRKFFEEDRRLARRRLATGLALGLVSLGAFYGCYAWVAGRAAAADISLGDMTLYLVVLRQGQGAFQGILSSIGAMYRDSLFMSSLFTFLELPTAEVSRAQTAPGVPAAPATALVPRPGELVFENVSFRYRGKEEWALRDVSLRIAPGEKIAFVGENGAGKSTLVKLIMRLYEPVEGRISYGGVDLRDLDPVDLRRRIGAVFQDAVKYQLDVRENVGLGDVPHLEDLPHIERAAKKGGATELVRGLPEQWRTVLGGWFERGQELSGGQWQRIAVSRGFMREDAEILVLDEPSASIDAEAEAELFERLRRLAEDRIAIIISHRFSTVRIADRIVVLSKGQVVESGTHDELIARGGRYAHLFELQARGYQ